MLAKGLVIDAAYLEGDRQWPLEDSDENIDVDGGEVEGDEDAQDGGNESDRTVVFEDAEALQDGVARMAVSVAAKADELEGAASPAAVIATEVREEGLDVEAGRTEVLFRSSQVSLPTAHGDGQDVDGGRDVSVAASETLSQPGWEILAKPGDSSDVDGML